MSKLCKLHQLGLVALACLLLLSWCPSALGALVDLDNNKGAATFFQNQGGVEGDKHDPKKSVDQVTTGVEGWAIFDDSGVPEPTDAQTAVWQTINNVSAPQLVFSLIQNFDPFPAGTVDKHLIGHYRFAVTSADRSLFGNSAGQVGDDSIWTPLLNPVTTGPAGMIFNLVGPNNSEVLVGGTIPGTATYETTFYGNFSNITGIRLDVLPDNSLPFGGPGLAPQNGNFVLTEITMEAVPIPGAVWLLGSGLIGLFAIRRKLKK